MASRVDEIAPDLFRISAFHPDYGMQFNQFLLRDEEPVLIHTGFRAAFEQTAGAVARLVAPSSLRWIGFSHFESDECGALNEWLAVAPNARRCAVHRRDRQRQRLRRSPAAGTRRRRGARHRPSSAAVPRDTAGAARLGRRALLRRDRARASARTCSSTPAIRNRSPNPTLSSAPRRDARQARRADGQGPPVHTVHRRTLQRLADLAPRTLAVMHGSSFRGDGAAAIRALAGVLADALGPPRAQ